MKKEVQDLKQKAVKELQTEVEKLRSEVAKSRLDLKVNRQKDTNIISKKRKRLAMLQTLINQKI